MPTSAPTAHLTTTSSARSTAAPSAARLFYLRLVPVPPDETTRSRRGCRATAAPPRPTVCLDGWDGELGPVAEQRHGRLRLLAQHPVARIAETRPARRPSADDVQGEPRGRAGRLHEHLSARCAEPLPGPHVAAETFDMSVPSIPSCRAACRVRSGRPAKAGRCQISSATSSCTCGDMPADRGSNSAVAASTTGPRSPDTANIGSCQPSAGGRCWSGSARPTRVHHGAGQRRGSRLPPGARCSSSASAISGTMTSTPGGTRSPSAPREHQHAERRRGEHAERVRGADDPDRRPVSQRELAPADGLEHPGLRLGEADCHS